MRNSMYLYNLNRKIFSKKSLLTVLTIAFLFSSCKTKTKTSDVTSSTPMSSAVSVDAVVVQPRFLERKISITGSIVANEEVELRSEVAGKVSGIYFSEGSRVSKGQLLVKINDNDLQAQLKKLALQDTLLSQDEFRKRALLEMNAVSKEEYNNALTQLQSIRAEKSFVMAQIEKTEIRAPFDGVIGLRYISEGGFVSPTFLIAAMQQVNPVKIEFSVPERYRTFLKNGKEIQFSITGSDEVFKGTVYAVESKIDPVTRTVKARAKCDNSKNNLVPGSFAKVELILEKVNDALVIPAQAVIPQMNGQKVFLIKQGKAKSVPVELGIRMEADTEIISGISAGDTLAYTGLLQLREGVDVNVSIENK
jgi:membrane fusion protein, multidrug efflux system